MISYLYKKLIMIQSKENTTEKLKKVSRKYNGLTATILENEKYHNKEKLIEVSQSIKRLIKKAKAKLEE